MRLEILTAVVTLALASPVMAASPTQQRELYQKTLDAIDAGNAVETGKGMAKLNNYILEPYLEYRILSHTLGTLTPAQVNAFVKKNADTPLEGRLRWRYTTELGKRGDWKNFEHFYQTLNAPNTVQQCYHGQALLHAHRYREAYNLAADLWPAGHSMPNECDPLFNTWIKNGKLTNSLIVKRVFAALAKGNSRLADYAAKQATSRSAKRTIQLAKTLFKSPDKLLKNRRLVTVRTPYHTQLLGLAVNRLSRRNTEQAITLWLRDRDRLKLSATDKRYLTRLFALRKATRFDENAEKTIARLDPNYEQSIITEWRIRLALTAKNWKHVSYLISKLPAGEQHSDRWRYWHAVANSHLGKASQGELLALSKQRSFYGFLAAQLTGKPYHLNHSPAGFSQQQLAELAKRPGMRRAHELYLLDDLYNARSEWNLATSKMTPTQKYASAYLVKNWGWYNQGIIGAARTKRWNDMELRFPNPYRKTYERIAPEKGISPFWATAITRQESAFWREARSRVGALGLMQLMPATARHTARLHDLDYKNSGQLLEPETNITLGSAYLGDMYKRFNNRAYATAAYNAGPKRVQQWVDERGELPLDIWIETIPFNETRLYVQNVLSYMVIYEHRANQDNISLFGPGMTPSLAFNQSVLAANN